MVIQPATPERRARPWGLVLLLVALFVSFVGAGVVVAPPPLRAINPPEAFDATTARERLARILGDEAPHPIDSTAQDAVRAALLREIDALGFTPEVDERFACRAQPRGPLIDCALVRNISFGIGPDTGPAILAATHYDSVPAAPGASDAGIGIATWLEIARILSAEPLERRVIFLISDGEEPALLGAEVFAASPQMQSVEALVNLEARGTRGPAVFFETNQPNADAVRAYAGAPRPLANSVMADVYALLSNSTDVTALTRPNLDVVNIALLDGLEDYHTPQDSLSSFNAKSLQHMGDMALATTRAFASGGDVSAQTPQVYTDIASHFFISAPGWLAQITLGLSVLLAAITFWRSPGGPRWRALTLPPLALVIAGVFATGAGFALTASRADDGYWFAYPEAMRACCVLLALLGVALAFMMLRVQSAQQAGAAGMLWFIVLGALASIFVPGISILFALPALIYALGCVVAPLWPPAAQVANGGAALLTILVWAPTLYLVELALGFDMPYATTILIALACFPAFGAIVSVNGVGRWRVAALALCAGSLAAIAGAALAPSATAERPRALNVLYFLDVSQNEARVLAGTARRALPSSLERAAPFEAQLVLPGDRYESWATRAPVVSAPTPTLADMNITETSAGRVVNARLALNGAYRAIIRIPRSARPIAARVSGVETSFADTGGEDSDYLNLACQGRACDGASIEIVLDAEGDRSNWFVIGQTPGFITAPAEALVTARGPTATSIQFGDGVLTLSEVPMD